MRRYCASISASVMVRFAGLVEGRQTAGESSGKNR